jgi:hypothetical protein
MFGQAKQQQTKPTAMGTLVQSSAYGATITDGFGMVQVPLLFIWAANLRQGNSGKKLKSKFKGDNGYYENICALVGCNPISSINQLWNNGGLYPLQLNTQVFHRPGFTNPECVIGSVSVPDPNFQSLIAVTVNTSFNETFNDYGSAGPVTMTGSGEMPLWNQVEVGPDPTNGNSFRNYPFEYYWSPVNGPVFYLDGLSGGGNPPAGTEDFTAYYYDKIAATSFESPLQKNFLHFESELGNGTEFSDAGLPSQQIIYPMFAGVGSSGVDLGIAGMLPAFKVEAKFKWGIWPNGDAEFPDMIEYLVKSGINQAALVGTSTTGAAFTNKAGGLQAYNFPGPVQKEQFQLFESNQVDFTFYQNNTQGNVLVCIFETGTFGPPPITITDDLGNDWKTAVSLVTDTGSDRFQIMYVERCAGGANTIHLSATGFYGMTMLLMEVQGVDSFDAMSISYGPLLKTSITTTNDPGFPSYIIAVSHGANDGGPYYPQEYIWPILFENEFRWDGVSGQYRTVRNPGTYTLDWSQKYNGIHSLQTTAFTFMLAFKSTSPTPVPRSFGNFVDDDSLNIVRDQCRAYGLHGAMAMTSQKSASDWIKMLYESANAAPCYEGFKLYSRAYAEQSYAGNGAVYIAPTAPGPVAFLSDLNGDFIKQGDDCVTVDTADRSALPNFYQMQCFSRTSNYNQITVSQPMSPAIALYGLNKADPIQHDDIQDVSVASAILGIHARRDQQGGDVYNFQIQAKYDWLSLMDLVNLTDTQAGIINKDVRITDMEEQDDGSWICQAEPFIFAISAPISTVSTNPTPSGQNNTQASAGNVNTPVFFEPIPRFTSNGGAELWIGVSSSSTIYGGCQVLISTDGGASYQNAGDPISGSATTGVSTADWPAASDPDTTNDLPLNLSESLGELSDYTATEENNFASPGYMAGGAGSIPYEIFSWGTALLTSANNFNLKATGSGNQLRRAAFGCPTVGAGVDHPLGTRFLWLDPSSKGIMKIALPAQWIGTALKFKFLSFNTQFGGLQDPSTVTVYTYTPTGVAQSGLSYSQVPAIALSQPTSTSIAMAGVVVTFPTNSVKYNARTFTIAAPSSPTWYYVTIADPSYIGDTGSGTTLTPTCSTSSSLVGTVGNTFIGAILALPGGGATTIIQGGWPVPQLFTVNGS